MKANKVDFYNFDSKTVSASIVISYELSYVLVENEQVHQVQKLRSLIAKIEMLR